MRWVLLVSVGVTVLGGGWTIERLRSRMLAVVLLLIATGGAGAVAGPKSPQQEVTWALAATLPKGTVGALYPQGAQEHLITAVTQTDAFGATYLQVDCSWSAVAGIRPAADHCGELPPGLHLVNGYLDEAKRQRGARLYGIPTKPGTYAFTVGAAFFPSGYWPNDKPLFSTKTYTIAIAPIGSVDELQIGITGPKVILTGESAEYPVLVRNPGTAAAKGVLLKVDFHGLPTKVVAHSQGSCRGDIARCELGTLPAKGTATATFQITPPRRRYGKEYFYAYATTAQEIKTNKRGAVTKIEVLIQRKAELAVVKTGPAKASAGDSVDWLIRVKNKGPDDTRVQLEDKAPPNVTFKRVVSTHRRCTFSIHEVECAFDLAQGKIATITISGEITIGTKPGSIENVARAKTDDRDDPRDSKSRAVTRID